MRYIEKQRVIERIRDGLRGKMNEDEIGNCFEYARLNLWVKEWLDELPTVDVRSGRWEVKSELVGGSRRYWIGCSVCGNEYEKSVNYCPNCGSRMVSEDE